MLHSCSAASCWPLLRCSRCASRRGTGVRRAAASSQRVSASGCPNTHDGMRRVGASTAALLLLLLLLLCAAALSRPCSAAESVLRLRDHQLVELLEQSTSTTVVYYFERIEAHAFSPVFEEAASRMAVDGSAQTFHKQDLAHFPRARQRLLQHQAVRLKVQFQVHLPS